MDVGPEPDKWSRYRSAPMFFAQHVIISLVPNKTSCCIDVHGKIASLVCELSKYATGDFNQ